MGSTIIVRRALERPLTETMFCGWCGMAPTGDQIVYHRGFLALDVSPLIFKLPEPERRELLRVAQRALRLAEEGRLHLLQLRNGEEDFTYVAVARPRPPITRGRPAEALAARSLPDVAT